MYQEVTEEDRHRSNVLRNMGPEWVAWYESLPAFAEGAVVKCPTKNRDGSEAAVSRGCGSSNVTWGGDAYDCHDCGIFFSDWAADPPHRRDDRS